MRSRKKIRQGVVVSDKMDKTVVVQVKRTKKHTLYKRTIKDSKKYKVHDENNECKVDDIVRLIECKPISKEKNWRLMEIVQKAI